MRYLTVSLLLISLLLSACSTEQPQPVLSGKERTALYETAIEAARDETTNEALPLIDGTDDNAVQSVFDRLNVTAKDMSAYAVSVSPTNEQAYAVAAIYPAPGKEDAILESLRRFVVTQQQTFREHLSDQYEIAVNTRVETLEDGTILMVMSEQQDAVFDAVRDVIERGS